MFAAIPNILHLKIRDVVESICCAACIRQRKQSKNTYRLKVDEVVTKSACTPLICIRCECSPHPLCHIEPVFSYPMSKTVSLLMHRVLTNVLLEALCIFYEIILDCSSIKNNILCSFLFSLKLHYHLVSTLCQRETHTLQSYI